MATYKVRCCSELCIHAPSQSKNAGAKTRQVKDRVRPWLGSGGLSHSDCRECASVWGLCCTLVMYGSPMHALGKHWRLVAARFVRVWVRGVHWWPAVSPRPIDARMACDAAMTSVAAMAVAASTGPQQLHSPLAGDHVSPAQLPGRGRGGRIGGLRLALGCVPLVAGGGGAIAV